MGSYVDSAARMLLMVMLLIVLANGTAILPFTQRLQAPNRGSGTGIFGRHLAVSANGLVAVVGDGLEANCGTLLPGDSACSGAGAAYIYTLQQSTQTWAFTQYLKPTRPVASFLFGCAVAVSADGSVVVVSSCKHKANGTGIFNGPDPGVAESTLGQQQNGALYVFQRATGQTQWTQVSFILRDASTNQGFDFGSSLAISDSGTVIVACSAQFSLAAQALTTRTIHVFNSSTSGASWSLEQVISFDDTLNYGFGFILGLSGDGNTLAAGSYAGPPAGQPCVFFYKRSISGSWSQNGGPLFTASTLNNYLYSRLAVSANGNIVVVPTDFGATVFLFTGGNWTLGQSRNTTAAGASLTSVAISSAGDVIAVASNSIVLIFASGPNGIVLTQQFSSPDGGTQFGNDVTLSNSFLMVGDQSVGYAYVLPVLSSSSIGTNLVVSAQAFIVGNYSVSPGVLLTFSLGASLNVSGTLTIDNTVTAVLIANNSGPVTFLVAAAIVGQFGTVRVANAQCNSVFSTPSSVLYTPSTVSVVVLLPQCPSSSSDSLTTGEIVGIAVGAAVGGILLAIGISLLSVYLRRRYNERANKSIRGDLMMTNKA